MVEQLGTSIRTCCIVITRGVKCFVHIKHRHNAMSAGIILEVHVHHPTEICRHILRNHDGAVWQCNQPARTIVYGHGMPVFVVLQHILHFGGVLHLQFLFMLEDSSSSVVNVRQRHVRRSDCSFAVATVIIALYLVFSTSVFRLPTPAPLVLPLLVCIRVPLWRMSSRHRLA